MKILLANVICFAAIFLRLSNSYINGALVYEPMEVDRDLVEPEERDFLGDFLLERQNSMTQTDFVAMLAEQIQNGLNLQTVLLRRHYGDNPLFKAAKNGHMDVLRFLVRYGDSYFLSSEETCQDWILIIHKLLKYAILKDSYEVFEHIFYNCQVVNLNFLASFNYILACIDSIFCKIVSGTDNMVFGMLTKLVQCSTKKYGASGHAVLAQYPFTLEKILALSSQFPQVVGRPEMHKLLVYLLDEGFCHSKSPLTLSMVGFHSSYIPILEQYNVNFDGEDLFGNSTLMLSLQMFNYRHRVPQIQILIKRTPNLDAINDMGDTALSIALIPIPKQGFKFPMKYYKELCAQAAIVDYLLSAGASPVIERIFCRDQQKYNWDNASEREYMDLFDTIPDLCGNPLLTRTIQHWIRVNGLTHRYPLIMSLDGRKLLADLNDSLFWESVEMWKSEAKINEELTLQVKMFWDCIDAKIQKVNHEKLNSLGLSTLQSHLQIRQN